MINEPLHSLKQFEAFSNLSDKQYLFIKQNASLLKVPANKLILKLGAEHRNLFVLLQGKLKICDQNDHEDVLSAGSEAARSIIARIRPSLYRVSSLTDVKIITFSEDILNKVLSLESADGETTTEKAHGNPALQGKIIQNKILADIGYQLKNELLVLPSMPDIAFKIRTAIEDEDSDINDVIKIINMDPPSVALLVNTANSVLYNPSGGKIENCKAACMRLGGKMIMNLVLSHATKELFKSDSTALNKKMSEMWQHSVRVAAISSVLARLTPGFDHEKALLAGLLHNIGSVAILNYLSREKILIEDSDSLHDLLFSIQAEVGEKLLKKWDFSHDLIEIVSHSTNLFYTENEQPNYIDIINIAQVHAYIGTPYQDRMPTIDQLPAYKKLALGQLTPELSIKVLVKSQDEIDQTIALFS